MQREPPPFIWAAPDEKNILNCTLHLFTFHSLTNLSPESRELLDRELAVLADPNLGRSHPETS